jgi:hypothetical protein
MGIYINGGTVIATGHMLDRIEDGGQNYTVFQFAQKQTGSETVTMKDQENKTLLEVKPENAYSILIFSSPNLKAGNYTLWSNEKQLAGSSVGMMGGPGMGPGGMDRPERPDIMQPPADGGQPPEGFTPPEAGNPPEGFPPPEGGSRPEKPAGNDPGNPGNDPMAPAEMTVDFVIRDGGNMFSGIS